MDIEPADVEIYDAAKGFYAEKKAWRTSAG